ncbi:MAG: LEPR-XLL domain-containing protein, partial [Pseudomonadales bacterium]|nr:LEPR-XLL domain-containing protein [Pseudomonadales bacterium]
MGKKPPNKKAPAPLIEALEPRILFSADAFGAALDIDPANDPLADALEQARLEYDRTLAEAQKAEAQKAAQQKSQHEPTTSHLNNSEDAVLSDTPTEFGAGKTHELVLVDT